MCEIEADEWTSYACDDISSRGFAECCDVKVLCVGIL